MLTRYRAARNLAADAALAAALLIAAAASVTAQIGAATATAAATEADIPRLLPTLGEVSFAAGSEGESRATESPPASVWLSRPGGFLLAQVAAARGPAARGTAGTSGPAVAADSVGADPLGPSPKRALLLSGLLPGAGEFYAGSKKRAALFFGLEAAAWGVYLSWTGKGNDLEDDFRAVANEEWDPWNYLQWRTSTISRFSSITHALPCSSYVASAATSTPTGEALSGCPSTEKQQYYELIGKYDQYISGWSDLRDHDGNPVQPTEVDSAENYLSELRLDYENQRNESNKYLKRASNISGFILVNHVLSAIDAARVARARTEGASEAAIERRTRFALVLRGDPAYGRGMPMMVAYRPIY